MSESKKITKKSKVKTKKTDKSISDVQFEVLICSIHQLFTKENEDTINKVSQNIQELLSDGFNGHNVEAVEIRGGDDYIIVRVAHCPHVSLNNLLNYLYYVVEKAAAKAFPELDPSDIWYKKIDASFGEISEEIISKTFEKLSKDEITTV